MNYKFLLAACLVLFVEYFNTSSKNIILEERNTFCKGNKSREDTAKNSRYKKIRDK